MGVWSQSSSQQGPGGINIGKSGGGINPFLSLPDPDNSVDYKKGYVMRKCCIDPNGKKTKVSEERRRPRNDVICG